MNEKKLFQKTFSKIHASDDIVKEIIAMNGKQTNRTVRRAVVAVLCVGVLAGGTLTVNAATQGEFFRTISKIITVGENSDQENRMVIQGGEPGEAPAPSKATVNFPDNAVDSFVFGEGVGFYTTDQGESWLKIEGQQDKNITEALNKEGSYTFEIPQNGSTVSAGVEVKKNAQGESEYHCYSKGSNGEIEVEGWIGRGSSYSGAI